MKKYIALILCVLALSVLSMICVAAEPMQEAGYWVENAEKMDEILAGEAGEKTVGWEVPFLLITPTIDGTIAKNEYQPFELYEDYLSWMAPVGDDANPAVGGTTLEEFQEFYDSTQQDFFDAWWGWDGTYMYVAFEINCLNGYKCDPEQDVLLFAYNCLQVGIADVEAMGKDPSYVELGCGVHSETGDPITFNWSGNYCPRAGEDFIGTYDAETQTLVYEMRIHLQSALGSDHLVENDDEINYAWLLAVNGQAQNTNETWQLAFCHGIGGQYSGKMNQYFARVTFTGKPDDLEIKPIEIPGISEEDKEYGLTDFVDLSDENAVKTFEAEKAAVEYVTEGDESFMRITSLSGGDSIPYVYSTKYPKNVLGGAVNYLVVKYRTTHEESPELGLIYRTVNYCQEEYDVENCYYEFLESDGQWHTVIFYMDSIASWNHFILNIGFAPFLFADNSSQSTIDIAWMKFYQQDPTDLYYEDYESDPDEDTDAGDETDAPTDEPTDAPNDAVTTTVADTDQSTDDNQGCASVVGLGAVAVIALAATAIIFKKKED